MDVAGVGVTQLFLLKGKNYSKTENVSQNILKKYFRLSSTNYRFHLPFLSFTLVLINKKNLKEFCCSMRFTEKMIAKFGRGVNLVH